MNQDARHVGAGYLGTAGIPLLPGRDFQPGDETRQPVPALINRATARELFGSANPIGRRIRSLHYKNRPEFEIVGLTGDARQIELTADPGPQIYVPAIYGYSRRLVVRTASNAGDSSRAVRQAVRRLAPEAPAPEIAPLTERLAKEVARPRFYLVLLGAFASIGLLLAAVGVYGVTAYSVARRSHEFGIRLALGAAPGDILRLVLSLGARIAIAGATLGLADGWAATHLMTSLLYHVKPGDPMTLACVAALLIGTALAASYLAARRATGVDPSVALRAE